VARDAGLLLAAWRLEAPGNESGARKCWKWR